MNDIGPEAKTLFEAARSAERLPGPKRARIKQAVLLQAATLGAASTVAGGAVAMSMAAKVTLVTVTAAVLGGGSVSVWAWKKHKESTATTRTTPTLQRVRVASAKPPVIDHPAAVQEATPAPTPAVVEPAPRSLARPEARRAPVAPMRVAPANPAPAPERSAGPSLAVEPVTSPSPAERPSGHLPAAENTAAAIAKAPSPGPASLDAELTLLRQAQEDLRLGFPAQALGRLADFDHRFPKARLDQERQAIEAIAGCQAYPGPAATARGRSFLLRAPLSPLAARVRSACHTDDGKSPNENGAHREP